MNPDPLDANEAVLVHMRSKIDAAPFPFPPEQGLLALSLIAANSVLTAPYGPLESSFSVPSEQAHSR